jgi:hypothetical protein
LALQFYNSFGDEPILNREELLNIDQVLEDDEKPTIGYRRISKFQRFTQVVWPGTANMEEYINVDEEGNIHLRSVDDDVAEIVLSKNGFLMTVTYLYLLPFKKP